MAPVDRDEEAWAAMATEHEFRAGRDRLFGIGRTSIHFRVVVAENVERIVARKLAQKGHVLAPDDRELGRVHHLAQFGVAADDDSLPIVREGLFLPRQRPREMLDNDHCAALASSVRINAGIATRVYPAA